jgi:hypothetical protein
MKLESWQSAEDKRRWKIVRTDDYTDVPGDIITADEASGECCVQIAGGVAIVAALAVRSTLGDALPPLMSGHQEVPLQKIIPGGLCLLAMIALCCTIAPHGARSVAVVGDVCLGVRRHAERRLQCRTL